MTKIDYQNWNYWMEYGKTHKDAIQNRKYSERDLVYQLYQEHMGKELPDDPHTFTEIINHMKLDPYISRKYCKYIDKYLVRKYVKKKVGEKYLIPLMFCKKRIDVADLAKLPDSFVLKTNNGSGTNHIVIDKKLENLEVVCDYMNYLTTLEFAYLHGEWAYRRIKPRIIAEKLIKDDSGNIPDDLKCFCFKDKNGVRRKVLYIERVIGDERYRVFLNENWEVQDINCNFDKLNISVERPDNYKEVLWIIDRLSEDFPFVRVDLYLVGKNIYFGELTFTPTAGYMQLSDETNLLWGTYIGYKKHLFCFI